MVWTTAVDPVTGAPNDEVTGYPSDASQLIAVIQATAVPSGAALEAAWSYNETALDAFSTRLTTEDSAATRWVAFHLQRDPNTPWPPGTYEVAISLDGSIVRRSAVEVTGSQ